MTIINIEIWGDPVCPWCFIGKRNLDQALYLYKRTYCSTDEIRTTYRSFFLYPDDTSSMTMQDRMVKKNGEEMANGIRTRLMRTGASVGIKFSFEGRLGNTLKAQQLLKAAQKQGRAAELTEAFYRWLWEDKGDVLDEEGMTRIAVSEGGLTQEQAKDALADKALAEECLAEFREAKETLGIKAVPTIRVNGQLVEGSHDPGEFLEKMVAIKEGRPSEE